jgi:hypothetical protein
MECGRDEQWKALDGAATIITAFPSTAAEIKIPAEQGLGAFCQSCNQAVGVTSPSKSQYGVQTFTESEPGAPLSEDSPTCSPKYSRKMLAN